MEGKEVGGVSYTGGIVQDLIEHEIRRNPEQLLASLMSAPNVGVAICDRDYCFRGVNEALAAMNGVPAKAHFGQSIYDILGDFAAKVDTLFRYVIMSGQPVLNAHITGKLPNREEDGHWVENYFPLMNRHGQVERVCAMVIEVTEQKRLERSLKLLHSNCKDESSQLKTLLEFQSDLTAGTEASELAGAITGLVNRVIPHDYATLVLEDEAARWLANGSRQGTANLAGVMQASRMREGGEGCWDRLLGHGIESVYKMPLVTKRAALGTLHLASRRKNAFEQMDRELAGRVAMQVALALDYVCATKEIEHLKERFGEQKIHVVEDPTPCEELKGILGESPALKAVLEQGRKVARTDATVLILGETGTGKELMARAIHGMSLRKEQSFIKINCAAIPTGLLESELFGHERGAFTGALSQKVGRLELAHGGTLLLDEIGDLPLELQPKLLRVLQDGEFERLGGTRTIRVNVRLIAATNRDLGGRVAEDRFRSDLYYRLNVFPICMPPLRDRRQDIPQLARYFVQKFARLMKKNIETIPNEMMWKLERWDWPGNIRELEHFAERSVIMTGGRTLEGSLPESDMVAPGTVERTLKAVERDYILEVLRGTGGRISGKDGAAAKLGMKRTTLQSKMRKLSIRRCDYRAEEA
jgi:formate hydrogenlyase transcriptional activator